MNDFIYTFDYILDNFLPVVWAFIISNWVFSLVLLMAIVTTIAELIISNHADD